MFEQDLRAYSITPKYQLTDLSGKYWLVFFSLNAAVETPEPLSRVLPHAKRECLFVFTAVRLI